jgi:hypothetical protein
MSDRRLRELERAWHETGSVEARADYNAALARAGQPKLPRLVIRHYIAPIHHGCVGPSGKIETDYDLYSTSLRIHATCSVELWPRGLRGPEWAGCKELHYTEDPREVTCKTCLRSVNKPDVKVRRRAHYAPGARYRLEETNERVVVPVCGRDDSDKFEESFIWDLSSGPLTCPACKRIMQKGQRRSRRPGR